MKVKYLTQRGNKYQFSRSVPSDVRGVIGRKFWRESLNTDSLEQAEIKVRAKAAETDTIISDVRNGTYRMLSDSDVDQIAVRWSIDFDMANRRNIRDIQYPDLADEFEPIGDESTNPIFSKRSQIELNVSGWMSRNDIKISKNTPDWDAVIDACTNEFIVANPQLTDQWWDIIRDEGVELEGHPRTQVIRAVRTSSCERRLSKLLEKYLSHAELAPNTAKEITTAVRRFRDINGEIDVTDITRKHIEIFRDHLRQFPSRPPNKIRDSPIQKQVEWANINHVKLIGQNAINKNIMGIRLLLKFAFEETSLIEDRNWINPCVGFTKKPPRPKNPRLPLSSEQIKIAFSREVFQPKSAEDFWIPIILFYTGARLDEICQLHVSDIRKNGAVCFINCENLEDDDIGTSKKVKNLSSHRHIPIHDNLIEMGLLKYVSEVKQRHLFPNLPHHLGGGRGNAVSRRFTTSFRNYGIDHPETGLNSTAYSTHSLRHTFRTVALDVADQEFVLIVQGHYVEGESWKTYARQAYFMPQLGKSKVMDKIDLPPLDSVYLKGLADEFLTRVG